MHVSVHTWDVQRFIYACVHMCTYNFVFTQEAKRQKKTPHLFPMVLQPVPSPPGHPDVARYTPVHHAPPHSSQALRMLVRIMHVHSAAVTRAILAQLCSSVIEVSSGLPCTLPSSILGQGWDMRKETYFSHFCLSGPLRSH